MSTILLLGGTGKTARRIAPRLRAAGGGADAAGVRHITMLSARGVEHAPPEHPHRATELELGRRTAFTHSILRPSWFMQDFDEYVFAPSIVTDGTVVAPVGEGTEAFIHVDDIADVAAATLLDPDAHVGAESEQCYEAALTALGAVQAATTLGWAA